MWPAKMPANKARSDSGWQATSDGRTVIPRRARLLFSVSYPGGHSSGRCQKPAPGQARPREERGLCDGEKQPRELQRMRGCHGAPTSPSAT